MSILVVAEHDNTENKSQTRVALAAAQVIGGDIDVLVAGSSVDSVASQVAAIRGNQCSLLTTQPMKISWQKIWLV